MFVSPRWLRISGESDYAFFEVKDLDESFSEIMQVCNGGLTDDNFAEMPYEVVAWHGWVREAIGMTPSWKGHVHDGISAKRLAAGYVGKDDVPYDGSLGVLLSPEDDSTIGSRSVKFMHHTVSGGPSAVVRKIYGDSSVYLLCGKFGFAPGGGGAAPFDIVYRTDDLQYTRQIVATVPFDPTELKGPLTSPVVVATLRAEMAADTFPERGMQFRTNDVLEERFVGLAVSNIELFPMTGQQALGGSERIPDGYVLLFTVVLPGPDHPISQGVGRWWVDWMMLCRMAEGLDIGTV